MMRVALIVVALVRVAHADTVLASASAGRGTSGTTAAAALELALGEVALAARGELADRRATVLVGLAPRVVMTPSWQPRCATSGRRRGG